MQSIPNSDDPVTTYISTYSYFQKHESETVSLVKGGKRFYGELFDTQLSRTFSMSVPNVDASSDAFSKCLWQQMQTSVSQNTHTYKVNGAQLALDTFPIWDLTMLE